MDLPPGSFPILKIFIFSLRGARACAYGPAVSLEIKAGKRDIIRAMQNNIFRNRPALGVKGPVFVENNLLERVPVGNPLPESGVLVTNHERISSRFKTGADVRMPNIRMKVKPVPGSFCGPTFLGKPLPLQHFCQAFYVLRTTFDAQAPDQPRFRQILPWFPDT